jgi:phosphate transport system ATP-binding protein
MNPSDPPLFDIRIDALHYGAFLAVRQAHMTIPRHKVSALIGPSGCGKSTVLRCLNRMNDLIPDFRLTGRVLFNNQDLYAPDVDPVAVRRNIGMVFQKPNPFAMSIADNVAYGLRITGYRGQRQERVEQALRQAALWDEVKDQLQRSAQSLSGGQQQRLCIARAIATEPEVLLMDEPCSALDPVATEKIENLMQDLKQRYTIVLVTHNLQQARRVADRTAFFYVETHSGGRTGFLVEHGATSDLFENPRQPQLRDYLLGKFS